MKIYFLFLCLLPLSIYGQSIQENLDYINTQFEKYNKYNTRFEVDEVSKTITCQDKFGTFIAFFEDIDFHSDTQGKNIGIFCLDQSTQCISSIQNDGVEGPAFSEYTMDLLENNEVISHIGEVLEKFISLKKIVLESGNTIPSSQVQRLKYNVDLQLEKLNVIFKKQAANKNIWSFDWDNYWLIDKSDHCKVYIPIEKVSVDYQKTENAQLTQHGYVFRAEDFDILEQCKTAEKKVRIFSGYLDSLAHATKAIKIFNEIQLLISDGPEFSTTPADKVNTDQLLSYVNSQFKKYNQYNTRFFVDHEKQELIWIQEFGETRAAIDQLDVKADYENGWLVIFCKDKTARCINSANGAGKTLQTNEYSMSLKENDTIVKHIDEVVEKMKELILTVQTD